MNSRERFERIKVDVLDTRGELASCDKEPNGNRFQQLNEKLRRQRKAYEAALAELRGSGEPLEGVDLLRW